MGLLYSGQFIDRNDNIIKADIYKNGFSGSAGNLDFPAESPVTIEWSSDKEDTIIGSTCTLTIISPGDRTYVGLYTVEPGSTWLKLSRKEYNANTWKLLWQGSLDTEFYEEPYSRNDNYDVTLTFSDFGLLQRQKFSLEGIQTLRSIVQTALGLCAYNGTYTLNDTYISTHVAKDANRLWEHLLTEVQIDSANFTDEDGETSTWYDVLEDILKPLALRIEQRAGQYYVYDFNALCAGVTNANADHTGTTTIAPIATREVHWASDDSMLAVDKTANNVVVTFSQYAEGKLFDADKCKFETGGGISRNNGYGYLGNDINLYSSYKISFSSIASPPAVSGIATYGNNRLFKIEPIEDGSDASGVALFIGGISSSNASLNEDGAWPFYDNSTFIYQIGNRPVVPTPMQGNLVYRTERFAVVGAGLSRYMRITVPILMDGRYNPFAETDSNHNNLHSDIKKYANAVYMRIDIKLYDSKSGGNLLGVYQNYPFRTRNVETGRTQVNDSNAGWNMTSNPFFSYDRPALLEWCSISGDTVDSEDCGTLSGMQANHEAFHFANKVKKKFGDMKGMYVPMPQPSDTEMWCEISVYDEIYIYDKGTTFPTSLSGVKESVYKRFNWVLIGWPTVEMVKPIDNGDFGDLDAEDIEASGIINTSAQDEISISTICGTSDEPTARGAYLVNYSLARNFVRAGRTTSTEQLLIGTIYSQYAGRKLQLSGTASTVVPIEGLKLITDANTSDKKYLVTEETYDVIAEESEVVLTEISADSYTT